MLNGLLSLAVLFFFFAACGTYFVHGLMVEDGGKSNIIILTVFSLLAKFASFTIYVLINIQNLTAINTPNAIVWGVFAATLILFVYVQGIIDEWNAQPDVVPR
jgi:hypothetical protein